MLNYHQQPEPVLVCSPSSPPTVDGLPGTVVTNKGRKRKKQVSEKEGYEVPVTTATNKSCKRWRQNPEIQDNPNPNKLMINYFDKRFEGIEKMLQQPSNKNLKIEDTFKFRHKGNRVQFEFNEIILKIV